MEVKLEAVDGIEMEAVCGMEGGHKERGQKRQGGQAAQGDSHDVVLITSGQGCIMKLDLLEDTLSEGQ